MTWVRRQQPKHRCEPPVIGKQQPFSPPAGRLGDLWRCDTCAALWRIADPGPGICINEWRPATIWQSIRYWSQGHQPSSGGYQPTEDTTGPPPNLDDYELPPIADPPRQTGTDWLYTPKEGKA